MTIEDLPEDVPWRRLAVGANLADVTDRTNPEGDISAEAAIEGLAPSLALFQYVPPKDSDSVPDSTPYPGSRVVLLRAPCSFSGVQVVTTTEFRLHKTFRIVRRDYLPCIGGVLTVSIGSPEVDGQQEAPLYIRDLFPKRQEMVLNEVLGTETMDQEVDRHSVTKNWNVSGGFKVKGIKAGGGVKRTEVEESEHKRSSKESHVINVSHVHHVLTSYHLGSRSATLTVQPRPYEGSHWELLGGPRRVEGIQDFVVLANVPEDVRELEIEACLTIGFLGYVSDGRPPTQPLDPRQILDAYLASRDAVATDLVALLLGRSAETMEAWEKWIERYQRWQQVQEFVTRINTTTRVVTARLCASGTIDLSDPNQDLGRAMPITPRFEDMVIEGFSPTGFTTPGADTSGRSVVNYFTDRAFEAVRRLSGATGGSLSETEFSRLKHWQQLLELPRDHELLDAPIGEFASIAGSDRERLEASGTETLRNLVELHSRTEAGSEDEALRAIGPRLFEPSVDGDRGRGG